MRISGVKIRRLVPPKDSLTEALAVARFIPKDGDVIAISSKVVAIHEGRTVPVEEVEKESLIWKEADWYLKSPPGAKWRKRFTIRHGLMVGSAGIDESNGDGHYILYPEQPFKSAARLHSWIKKTYGLTKVGVIITDSSSVPLRRGALGFALAWHGFDPLKDYRGNKDLFGRLFEIEVANIADALASAATLEMGEGGEGIPIVTIRGANVSFKNRSRNAPQLIVAPEDDLFAPFFLHKSFHWKKRS